MNVTYKAATEKEPINNSFTVAFDFLQSGIMFSPKMVHM